MSSNPNRQRLMSPLDYVAALAGARPPEQEPAWAPGTDPRMGGQQMGPIYDAPFRPRALPPPPMPFADTPPPALPNPFGTRQY
jgi:hypothetical protein